MIRRNALIFHSGGLGDFVLSWPLGLALGRLYPQSRIIYVTQASKGALAAAVLRLDWRDAESSWPALYSDPAGMSDKTLTTIVESHSVFTYIASASDAFCKNVAALSPDAAFLPLRVIPPPGYPRHATDYLLEQLAPLPTVRTAVEQLLASIRSKGIGTRRQAGAQTILVHPGSGSREKCWPVSKFVQLIEKMSKKGRQIKVILGEVELERFAAAEITQLEGIAPLVKPATYVDLYDELSSAAAFIGNDSGPGHLAAMVGVPTISLFGPSNPAVWQPMGPKVLVLQSPNLATLDAADVDSAVEKLSCGG